MRSDDSDYLEGESLYEIWMPEDMKSSKWLKFIPFLQEPTPARLDTTDVHTEDIDLEMH